MFVGGKFSLFPQMNPTNKDVEQGKKTETRQGIEYWDMLEKTQASHVFLPLGYAVG